MKKALSPTIKLFLVSFALLLMFVTHPMNANAATSAQKEAFKNEIINMLESVETSPRDLSAYRITPTEFLEVYDDIVYGETILLWNSYYSNAYLKYDMKNSRIKNVSIINADSNVLNRYEVLKKNVENIQAGLKKEMTDLDKVIYFHNCLVEITSYKFNGYQSYGACGALGENQAVCAGYTKALNMLLGMEGIEAKYIASTALNHGWTLVKLDGQWYHIDATWDDTRSAIWGQVGHQYLLKNDEEFSKKTPHTSWDDPGVAYHSTSTRFSNWFVHNITGKMIFDGGYWYYVDNATNNLMKAKATGEEMQVLVNGAREDKISLLDVQNDVAIYMTNGTMYRSDETATDEKEDKASSTITTIDKGTYLEVTECWNNFALWRSGHYNLTNGLYDNYNSRICLDDYYTVNPNTDYTVIITEADTNMLIRELDENKKLIKSYNLKNSESFKSSENTKYLGISLYHPESEYTWTYNKYWMSFNTAGFRVGLTFNQAKTTVQDRNNAEKLDSNTNTQNSTFVQSSIFWNDINQWRSGHYNWVNGTYEPYNYRICLNDYYSAIPLTEYNTVISEDGTNMLIRELDADKKFITSHNLSDSDSFTTSENTMYLGISLYHPIDEKTWNYDKYLAAFNIEDFCIGLVFDESVDKTEKAAETSTSSSSDISVNTPASTQIKDSWNDFTLWRSGHYSLQTGTYSAYGTRICLKEYYEALPSTKYMIQLSDPNTNMLIRELDENKKLIYSYDLGNSNCFFTSSRTKYLGISLYHPENEYLWNYDKYKSSFINGSHYVGLSYTKSSANEIMTGTNETTPFNWNSFDSWRVGHYTLAAGKYEKNVNRICLDNYIEVPANQAYKIQLTASGINMLIREIDAAGKCIKSHNLSNGQQFTTSNQCTALGISLYRPKNEYSITVSDYQSLFNASDFMVGISPIISITDQETPLSNSSISTAHSEPAMLMIALFIIALVVEIKASSKKYRILNM